MKRRDGRSVDQKTLEEIRIRAVQRVQSGESPEVVIQTLRLSRSCIYTSLAHYGYGGWDALKTARLTGRLLKLKAVQKRWLYRTITGKSPLRCRLEFASWTREMIGALPWEKIRLRLSLASITRLLRQLRLSCQRPLGRAWEQDAKQVRR